MDPTVQISQFVPTSEVNSPSATLCLNKGQTMKKFIVLFYIAILV
jgi:hypothetical protein